jgi:hypothetical protein
MDSSFLVVVGYVSLLPLSTAAAQADQPRLARSRGARAWGLAWRAAAASHPLAETPDRPQLSAASAVARLTPAPDVGAVARRFFEHKEN